MMPIKRPLWLGLLMAALSWARADDWQRRPVSAAELAQGYRSDAVVAEPVETHRASADAEEAAEGTVVRRRFQHLGAIRAIAVRDGETPEAAVARLAATGRYRYVEVDRIRWAAGTSPTDPLYSQQWGLNNTGTNSPLSGPGVAGADIHAPAAWDIRFDASSVLVATVDTGVRATHQDIAPNLWKNARAGADGYANDLHGIDATGTITSGAPDDDDGHGTHVAGIIGAVGNNGLNTSGVAWNAQIMALKFLAAGGGGSTTAELTCFNYAIAKGVQIINASYGSQGFSNSEFAAIQKLQQAGIILVCAAGNNTEDNDLTPSYPTNYNLDNIVSVAASDNRDSLVYFSSFGSGNVDVAAPGYEILSLYNTSDTATKILSGTSMATPMVTGALALLKAQFPADTYRQTINRLLRHVDVNPNFQGKVATAGRINLAAALASSPGDNTPFNDNFSSRSHVSGFSVTMRGSNTGASREPGEPALGANATGASLWYEWTAPVAGNVNVSTSGSASATLVGVFTGTRVDALAPTASGSGTVSFTAQAGITYEFAVDGQQGATGLTVLSLSYGNNSFATATTLAGANIAVTDTSANGAANGALKIGTRTPLYAVWYTWTAPATAHVQLSVSSPDFDPVVAVYTGSALGALTVVGSGTGSTINSANDSPVSGATIGFVATAGVAYTIELGGKLDSTTGLTFGQFTLSVSNARWALTSGDAFNCSPAVAADGTIYIGGDSGVFYAVKPDGSTKWTYNTGSSFDTSSAAIGPDGTIYAGAFDGNLYAFTPAGAVKWKYAVPNPGTNYVACSPAVAPDGTLYFKDSTATFYAINPTGTLKWTAAVPGGSYAAPSLAPDGTVYIGSDDGAGGGKLYAFSATGSPKWSFSAGNGIFTAPALDSSGNIYFSTLGGVVYALTPAGAQIWSRATSGGISSAPTLGTNGTLYFGSYDHNLYALSAATGAIQWTYLLGAQVRASSPVVDSNGVIYVGCYDGYIYAINSSGSLSRTLATGNLVRSSPAIAGTTLLVGSGDCRLYAFDLGAAAAASNWPMYLASPRRLGRPVSDALGITTEPSASVALTAGAPLAMTVAAVGQGPLSYQWQFNGVSVPGATGSTFVILNPTTANYGSYSVVVTGPQGSVVSTPSVVGPSAAPVITTQPSSQSVNTGGSVNLTVGVSGGNLSYQWYFGATAINGATGPNLSLTNVGANQSSAYGAYSVTASNSFGSATSGPAALTVTTSARLLNLSARGNVGASTADYLVAGFVTAGGTKAMLVRGIGPALAGFGVTGALTAPQLSLFAAGNSTAIASNGGWSNDAALAAAFAATGAFALPANSADAAVLKSLPAGNYSVQIAGGSGVALAEIYDGDNGGTPGRLVNLSARANVGTGANAASAGFVISGTTSETILIRGIGPSLSQFGLTGVLAAPTVTLFNPSQTALQTNAGWGNSPALSAIFASVSAFAPTSAADAALVVTLPPGAYSAQLSGVGSTTGVALVEIYEVR
jgi:outer membrane protein assembly factor BamB/subtilisin family serine protease